MANEARRFIYYFGENGTYKTLKQYRERFNELSKECQYEILCKAAQMKSDPIKDSSLSLTKVFRKTKFTSDAIGIIDILNHIFPQGTTIEQMQHDMPEELYNNLGFYEGSMKRLIDNLHVFRNESGEISEEKVTTFLSNPNVRVHTGEELQNVFEHINPDNGMDRIQRIISGRIQHICKKAPIKQGERKCCN